MCNTYTVLFSFSLALQCRKYAYQTAEEPSNGIVVRNTMFLMTAITATESEPPNSPLTLTLTRSAQQALAVNLLAKQKCSCLTLATYVLPAALDTPQTSMLSIGQPVCS